MTGKTWQVTYGNVSLQDRKRCEAAGARAGQKGPPGGRKYARNRLAPRRIEIHQIDAWLHE